MKVLVILTALVLVIPMNTIAKAHGLTCAQIRERATAAQSGKRTKNACFLVTHSLGLSPGSTESVYSCGSTRYQLNQQANDDCTVTRVK